MITVLDWSRGTYWSRLGGIGYGKVEVGGPLLYMCLLTKKPAKQFCLVTGELGGCKCRWSDNHSRSNFRIVVNPVSLMSR